MSDSIARKADLLLPAEKKKCYFIESQANKWPAATYNHAVRRRAARTNRDG